jgi:hypothetical protein
VSFGTTCRQFTFGLVNTDITFALSAYLIYKYGFTGNEAIGLMRLIRPGMVVGPQQQWLVRNAGQFSRWVRRCCGSARPPICVVETMCVLQPSRALTSTKPCRLQWPCVTSPHRRRRRRGGVSTPGPCTPPLSVCRSDSKVRRVQS